MHSLEKDDRILFNIAFENFIHNNLEIRELVICSMLIEGFSMVEISKHQRISYTYTKRIVNVIRSKIRIFLEEDCDN